MEFQNKKYSLVEVMHSKEFNEFLDLIMSCKEVTRISLADHILEEGWDSCDMDLDIQIKGGQASSKLGKVLGKYKKVHFIKSINKKTGKEEVSGHHGSIFYCVGDYYLEVAWGHNPFTVPYLVLRERGIRKKKWMQNL